MRMFWFLFLSINVAMLRYYALGKELIAHGEQYKYDEYPYVVCMYTTNALNQTEINLCTGSLVAPRFVLTAAHCTNNQINIRVGIQHYNTYFKILPL